MVAQAFPELILCFSQLRSLMGGAPAGLGHLDLRLFLQSLLQIALWTRDESVFGSGFSGYVDLLLKTQIHKLIRLLRLAICDLQ